MKIFVLKAADGKPLPTGSNLLTQMLKEDPRNKRLQIVIATMPDLLTKGKNR